MSRDGASAPGPPPGGTWAAGRDGGAAEPRAGNAERAPGCGPTRGRTPEARAERLARHAAETDPAVVLATAMRLLERRSRTTADLRGRLTRAGYAAPLVDGAIERLAEIELLDDSAFARAWVESRDRAAPRGERALRQELRLKGVPHDVAEAVLDERREAGQPDGASAAHDGRLAAEGSAPLADEAAADGLLQRRAASLHRIADRRVRRQRAYAILARNGFDPEVAAAVSSRFERSDGEQVDQLRPSGSGDRRR